MLGMARFEKQKRNVDAGNGHVEYSTTRVVKVNEDASDDVVLATPTGALPVDVTKAWSDQVGEARSPWQFKQADWQYAIVYQLDDDVYAEAQLSANAFPEHVSAYDVALAVDDGLIRVDTAAVIAARDSWGEKESDLFAGVLFDPAPVRRAKAMFEKAERGRAGQHADGVFEVRGPHQDTDVQLGSSDGPLHTTGVNRDGFRVQPPREEGPVLLDRATRISSMSGEEEGMARQNGFIPDFRYE